MHGVMKVVAAALILTGGAWGSVQAEQTELQKTKVAMEEVVVTASREAEPAARVPAHVTVVSANEIEKSTAQNVPEVLRTLVGIHVSDLGGNRRNYNVDLRGHGESSPQNILLLVDGRRINLPDLSGPDWNLIPLERVDRIEVIRGSRGNILYGDNATAGVINIITKEGRQLEGAITAAYGSYDTYKGAASISGAHDMIGYDLTATYFDTDGYRDNSESDATDVGANLWIDPTNRIRLHLSSGYHYDDTRNPGALLESELNAGVSRKATTHPLDYDKVEDYYVQGGLELGILSNDLFKLETSWRDREKSSYGTYSGGSWWFDADTETDILSIAPQLVFNENFGGVSNKIILGFDYTRAEQEYDSVGTGGSILAKLEKHNHAFYVHDELGIGEHLTLSGGYRDDRVEFKYDPANVSRRKMDEEAFDVGINYSFNNDSHIYASFNRGFRYPVLDEQFTYSSSSVNTSLQPQTFFNYEVGTKFEIIKGVRFLFNIFRIETEDEIFFNAITYENDNMPGETIRHGFEASVTWVWHDLQMGVGYTFTDTEFEDGPYDGKEVPFVPRDKATANINYAFDFGLTLAVDANYIGESYMISDFENESGKTDSYTVVNAKASYDWQWLTFFVNFNNLFDESYSSYSALRYNETTFIQERGYYPSPEFNVLAGVTARFGSI